MSKKPLPRWVPDPKTIREHKSLQMFSKLLNNPRFFHLTRYSVSTAFMVGVFTSWLPLPGQMVIGAGLAILTHSNVPIAVALAWLSNPVTTPFFVYAAYRTGSFLLQLPPHHLNFEPSLEWLMAQIGDVWQPFLLGSIVCGIVTGVLCNVIIRLAWRWQVSDHWRHRKQDRKNKHPL